MQYSSFISLLALALAPLSTAQLVTSTTTGTAVTTEAFAFPCTVTQTVNNECPDTATCNAPRGCTKTKTYTPVCDGGFGPGPVCQPVATVTVMRETPCCEKCLHTTTATATSCTFERNPYVPPKSKKAHGQ